MSTPRQAEGFSIRLGISIRWQTHGVRESLVSERAKAKRQAFWANVAGVVLAAGMSAMSRAAAPTMIVPNGNLFRTWTIYTRATSGRKCRRAGGFSARAPDSSYDAADSRALHYAAHTGTPMKLRCSRKGR